MMGSSAFSIHQYITIDCLDSSRNSLLGNVKMQTFDFSFVIHMRQGSCPNSRMFTGAGSKLLMNHQSIWQVLQGFQFKKM
jgi:hypothetical protein